MRLKDEIIVNKDGRLLDLKYYILEEPLKEGSDIIMYGIRVDMDEDYHGQIKRFSKTIHSMFTYREGIEHFAKILAENTVTPTTLQEIAEEYVDKKLYSQEA